jgi:hypothetical protein
VNQNFNVLAAASFTAVTSFRKLNTNLGNHLPVINLPDLISAFCINQPVQRFLVNGLRFKQI